jgi:hypothetical protein
MEAKMIFLDCPAHLDVEGGVRCGLPAEVRCRFTMHSSSGPLEGAMIRCPVGHWFNGPVEFLTQDSTNRHAPGTAAVASSARRDALRGSHHGRDGGDRFAVNELRLPRKVRVAAGRPRLCQYDGDSGVSDEYHNRLVQRSLKGRHPDLWESE